MTDAQLLQVAFRPGPEKTGPISACTSTVIPESDGSLVRSAAITSSSPGSVFGSANCTIQNGSMLRSRRNGGVGNEPTGG